MMRLVQEEYILYILILWSIWLKVNACCYSPLLFLTKWQDLKKMILASCNRPDIVLYLSSILVKIYLHATIYNTKDLFLQSEQEILVNDGSHIFFYDQTLNRQSNTICTHENWAPKMLARSESDTKNTFLYVDSNIILWGKSRNSFFTVILYYDSRERIV